MDKMCELYDRVCVDCGECDVCDLDPNKKCDNCCKCIGMDDVFRTIDAVKFLNKDDEDDQNKKDKP